MSATFTVEKAGDADGIVELRIGFGTPAQTPQIVIDAVKALRELGLNGGKLIRFNGPCALPVAMALAHAVGHLYGAVACFDPKLEGYVVCISHDPEYAIGQLLPV